MYYFSKIQKISRIVGAMKRYIVGGWVRDTLLKEEGFDIAPQDKDWVVVGASPEEMVKRGFIPVGADFPVFIDPKNGEELALARTERKSGKGYHGFVFHADPSVTLEEDLLRRDLTINAMAFDEDGSLIDCYGGKEDLKNPPKIGWILWSGLRGSNSLPPPWQGGALPDELNPHMVPSVGIEPTTRGFSVLCSTN